MLIPEVILYNTINTFLNVVHLDYIQATNKADSIIGQMFNFDDNDRRIIMQDFDYYKQASTILTRDEESVRKLHFNIGYNMQRMSAPTVHILMPSENKGRIDTIGHSEDREMVGNFMQIEKTRSNASTYYLMITSDNSSEVMIVYYWLKSMFLLFHEELELLGLRNLNHSGQDINLQQDLAPNNVFHRNLSLSFDFEFSTKIKIPKTIINGIRFGVCDNLSQDIIDYQNSHPQGT